MCELYESPCVCDDDDDDGGGGDICAQHTCGNQRAVLGISPHLRQGLFVGCSLIGNLLGILSLLTPPHITVEALELWTHASVPGFT